MLRRLFWFALIMLSFAIAWLMMAYDQFSNEALNLPQAGVNYQLEPGTSVAGLANDLERRGYLESSFYFRIFARLGGQAHKIKAGEFHLPAGTTPKQLLQLLISGKVKSHSLMLIEGWNFRQMLEAVTEHAALKKTLKELTDEQIMQRVAGEALHPEGRFLPDTYYFPRGTTDLAFLQRAFKAMERVLAAEWEKRDKGLPLKHSYEALILASIVEKETGQEVERPQIAGVFIRRLEKRMKLQADPTVIYGMGERYRGNIRRRDLKQETPYNTYVHRGLTPTPISMPGIDAIRAVLHPAEGKSLYFVAKGNGYHRFSNTLAEHNKAVRKYQLKK